MAIKDDGVSRGERRERKRVLGLLEELRPFFEGNRAWPRLINMVRHGNEPTPTPRKRNSKS